MNLLRLSPDELQTATLKVIALGYEELPRYSYVMRDLLSTGLRSFTNDIAKTREWDTRVLGMLQEARQLTAPVKRMFKGTQRLLDTSIVQHILDKKASGELPEGLSAEERRAWARIKFNDQVEVVEGWEQLDSELRAFIITLEDKHKDLVSVKKDLLAQLWAVRLHGHVGDDLKGLLHEGTGEYNSPNSIVSPGPPKSFTPIPQSFLNPAKEDDEISKLLGNDSSPALSEHDRNNTPS